MPNWVQIRFSVKGAPEAITRFVEAVRGTKPDADGHIDEFDFNRVIPMPEELQITSGGYGDTGYEVYFGDASKVLNYTWVKQEGITSVEELRAHLDAKDPQYRILGERYHENLQKYGFKNWYDWSIANWGTKWGACEASIADLLGGAEVCFDTAWSFPLPIMEKVVEMFPELTFAGQADEEGGFFYLDFTGKDGTLEITSYEGYREDGPFGCPDEEEEA